MKSNYIWIFLALFLVYGILPLTIPDYSEDYSQANTLLIERQECGCPCAEGVILKGQVGLSDEMKRKYPTLVETGTEITLVDFDPFDNITNEDVTTFDFANGNEFKVVGKVVGVDTILCDPSNCEVVPKFEVKKWSLTSYSPKFLTFSLPLVALYFVLGIIGTPALLARIFLMFKKVKT